jgi:hypothetical protein
MDRIVPAAVRVGVEAGGPRLSGVLSVFLVGLVLAAAAHATLSLNNVRPIRDGYVADNTPNSTFSGLRTAILGTPAGRHVLVAQYDLSAIPRGARVVTATLSFQKAFTDHSGAMRVEVRARRAAWSESSATWNSVLPTLDPLMGTANLDTGLSFPHLTDGALKPLVQRWLDDPATNFGITIVPADNTGTYISFRMREDLPSGEPIRLSLTYELPTPAEALFPAMAAQFEQDTGLSLRQQYDAGIKHLVDVHFGAEVVEAHLILDFDDLLGFTGEGREGWISTWIDASLQFGSSLYPFPVGVSLLAIERQPGVDDPTRTFSFETLYLNASGLTVSALTIDDQGFEPVEVELELDSGVANVGVLNTSWNALELEVRREALLASLVSPLAPGVLAPHQLASSLVNDVLSIDPFGYYLIRSSVWSINSLRELTASDDPGAGLAWPYRRSISQVYGGVDLNGDGKGDHYVPRSGSAGTPATFYPLRVFVYGDDIHQRDFFVRVDNVPAGWAIYPVDAEGDIVFDDEYPILDAEPRTLFGTHWVIASTPGAPVDVSVEFELYEDGVLGNDLLDTVHVRFSQNATVPPPPQCTVSITPPTSVTVAASGGSGAATVSAPSGCLWSPSSSASWVGASGSGGSLAYTVQGHTGTAARTATITLQPYGATVTIQQSGSAPPPPCSVTIAPPTTVAIPAGGAGGMASVSASAGCSWTPVSNASWLTGGGSGSTLTFTAPANPSTSARSATITLSPHAATLRVDQAGAATPAAPNLVVNPSFEGGTSGWTCNGCTFVRELSLAADGVESVLAQARAGAWAGPTQTVTQVITNGSTYSLSGWVRTTRPAGTMARFTFYLDTSTGVRYVQGPQATLAAGQFALVSGDVTLEWTGQLNEARLYVETGDDASAFYLDGVRLAIAGSAPPPTPPPPPPPPANLLDNPSFEQGPSGWTCNGCTHVRELTVVAAGNESAFASARAGSWSGPTQTITGKLTNGKTYAVSARVRTTRPEGSTARVTFFVRTSTGTQYVSGPQGAVSATQFTAIAGNVPISWSGTLLEARVYVETSGDSASFYLDDVVLAEQP